MSESSSFMVSVAEKFLGLLLIILGALEAYFSISSSEALGVYTWFFAVLGFILAALGILLIIAKTK